MILVTGATGFVGRHVVRQLVSQELPVRCFLTDREARSLPWGPDDPAAPELILGDILNEEAVFRAVTGVHTIIHLANAQWWGRRRELERMEISGTRTLIAAARAARVGRIITLSHLGASSSSAYTLHRIKGQVEEMIRASGLAYTIIRSGIIFGEEDSFINNIAMMLSSNPFVFFMPGRGEVVLHPIYIHDLVRGLLHSLESLDAVDRTIEVGGPEYTTLEDLLFTVMRVTGMQRLIVPLPPYLLRWITGIYSRLLPRSIMTPQWLDILATNRTTQLGNFYEHFGFQPCRLEDTLLTYLPERRYFWRFLGYSFRRRPRGV